MDPEPDRQRQNFSLGQDRCLSEDEFRWAAAASLEQLAEALSLCCIRIPLRPSFIGDGTRSLSCWIWGEEPELM